VSKPKRKAARRPPPRSIRIRKCSSASRVLYRAYCGATYIGTRESRLGAEVLIATEQRCQRRALKRAVALEGDNASDSRS